MRMQDQDWMEHLAIRAAWLSFVGGQTQGEIASQLGVSPAKVHRLIAHAQKQGLIKFQIEGRPLECLQLEDLLISEFGLKTCVIAPDVGGCDQESAIRSVSSVAAHVLAGLLSTTDIKRVGVGMGRTLKASFEKMPRLSQPKLEIVSICGSLTRTLAANPYDVVQLLQERTGGEGYYLPVPYFAESAEEKDIFLGQRSVQDLMAKARHADVFVIGIGSIEEEGHLVQRDMITSQEQVELHKSGAVCDLMGRFLTAEGKSVAVDLGDRAVGLHFQEVNGSRVIALVGGESKADATLAALRSGVITDLVADETLAMALSDKIGLKLARSA
ncbi:MAG: sugar-binding transcriptional regulator [Rhodobacteraceae bacterium]|nr:sugar-binding transcriptional regulator [Paracoccaceae bacterium]